MKISYSWLTRYLPSLPAPQELSEILTAIGLEVDSLSSYSPLPGGLKGLIVGEVLSCEKHPNAERLQLTSVDVGGEAPLPIVCGAPNVAKGQKVVVAPVGTELHPVSGEPFTIKKAKIRGEVSEGMICAEDEIGVGVSHEGIIVLPDDTAVGTAVSSLYAQHCDYVYEIGLTANRTDAMSHYGVARDVAAYLNQQMPTKAEWPKENLELTTQVSDTQITLGDIDPKGCIRYAGLTLRDVTVRPSPEWLANALRSIGQTPINNVVDVTNFVLHSLGQPLHAFDLRAFTTGKVSVQCCPQDTPFITLDEQERKLHQSDLTIRNGEQPLCLAGVFGGKGSGIEDSTTDVFLESAVFDPLYVRKTAKRHALNTDASFRFERGVDPQFTVQALRYAAQLILEVAGGKIDGAIIDFYPTPLEHRPLVFDSKRAEKLIGIPILRQEIETLFEGLEIDYRPIGAGQYELKVPYYRVDVTRQEDVVEEILRLYGYDRIPIQERMCMNLPVGAGDANAVRRGIIAERLVGQGFSQIICNSLTSSAYYENIEQHPEDTLVKVLNPLSADLNVLRPSLLLGALETIARNVRHRRFDLSLFEFGHAYSRDPKKQPTEKEPLAPYKEQEWLAISLYGGTYQNLWIQNACPFDIFHIKGNVEAILQTAAIDTASCQFEAPPKGYYESGVSLIYDGQAIAHFGRVAKALLERFSLKQPVFHAEVNWSLLQELWNDHQPRFVELPRFPEVRRDLALLVDKQVSYQQIESVAREHAGHLLQRVQLFDVYEGEQLPEGKKSYAVLFVLQDREKTLKDKEIDATMQRLIKALAEKLGAQLR